MGIGKALESSREMCDRSWEMENVKHHVYLKQRKMNVLKSSFK